MSDFPIFDLISDIYDLEWKIARLQDIPAKPGVYMLVNKFTNKVEYVGQGARLRYRLASAMHPALVRDLHIIHYLLVDDPDLRHYIEYRAIALLEPELNRRNGLYPMDNQANLEANYRAIFD